jgi:hypothetical protein
MTHIGKQFAVVAVLAALLGAAAVLFVTRPAYAQIPEPDKVRFRLVGDEPIASPDGRSFVAGWKIVVLQDQLSGQCHIAFLSGSAISVGDAGVCP